MFMGVWSVWAFDIFTLIASYLSVDIISAQTIMRSLGLTSFMIPFGFSMASGMLIGKCIGEGSRSKVEYYYKLCMLVSVMVAIAQNIFLVVFENIIIDLFTNIDAIAVHVHSAWTIFNVFVFVDTTQGIAASAVKASSKQQIGAVITFLAYWAIGIPVTCLMVFRFDQGTYGIWIGPTLACFFNTIAYLVMFKRANWDELIAKSAAQRLKDKLP